MIKIRKKNKANMFHKKKRVKYLYFVIFALLPVLFIFPYGKYRCGHKEFKDPLETQLFWGLDGWSATHFFWFMILGFAFPGNFILAFLIGCIWELFEDYYGKKRPEWLGYYYFNCPGLASYKEGDGNWWYGKWSDLLCNSIGYLIGQFFKTGRLYIIDLYTK